MMARAVAFVSIAGAIACRGPEVEARTDRLAYVLAAGDSVGTVRLTVRNQGHRPVYLQTVDGRVDVAFMIRVDSQGSAIVVRDAPGRERWSLMLRRNQDGGPILHTVRLDPDSMLASTYILPRGQYRILLPFGDGTEKLDEHGVWLERFSIR